MAYTGEQRREYQRRWIASRRQHWIDSQGGKCRQCGSTSELEIDHVDRSEKSIPVGELWSRRKEIRERELVKCQVLCSECHLSKTREEARPAHGTNNRYSGPDRCRCEACKRAHRLLAAETRARGGKW